MLVLSRKVNERVAIGSDIHITVLSVDGDKVKLGIEAPQSIRVFREELLEATMEQNKMAIRSALISFSQLKKEK